MDVPGDKLLEPVVCMVSGWLGEDYREPRNLGGFGPSIKAAPPSMFCAVWLLLGRMVFGALGWRSLYPRPSGDPGWRP